MCWDRKGVKKMNYTTKVHPRTISSQDQREWYKKLMDCEIDYNLFLQLFIHGNDTYLQSWRWWSRFTGDSRPVFFCIGTVQSNTATDLGIGGRNKLPSSLEFTKSLWTKDAFFEHFFMPGTLGSPSSRRAWRTTVSPSHQLLLLQLRETSRPGSRHQICKSCLVFPKGRQFDYWTEASNHTYRLVADSGRMLPMLDDSLSSS